MNDRAVSVEKKPSSPRSLARLLAPIVVASGCGTTVLSRAMTEPGAVQLPSGAVMRSIRAGEGATPRASERVQVAWEGRLVDGSVFTSSREAGAPLELTISQASRCWREALVRMHLGDKVHLTCVSEHARGGEVGPQAPEDTTVTFDLELLAVGSAAGEMPLPAGMVMKQVRAGAGDRPSPSDRVKVHYEGRLEDGTVFDSSRKRGTPATFPLSNVIPCWRMALQRMRVGEKTLLTCPPDLAYGSTGSPPSIPPDATLTFDVELLGVERGE